jgi:hypothetical protein
VYKQILIEAKLKTAQRGQKNGADKEKSIKEGKDHIELQCNLR